MSIVFGPGDDVLQLDGVAVAPLVVARSRTQRRRGLLGSDAIEGALWLQPCNSVHCFGMRYPIDVALLDRRGRVIAVRTLQPGALTFSLRVRSIVEAGAGAMTGWGIRAGRLLTVAPVPDRPAQGH